jgi:haloalkane dehalogenase
MDVAKYKNVKVLGSEVAYLEAGSGRPLIFVHGMPTSSYVWRHVIGSMQDKYRCLALDLIGMGKSGKPDIDYTIHDHVRYFTAWVDSLELSEKPILIMHGWGSVVGCEYARTHPDDIAGLVFYESHLRAARKWSMLSLPVQQWAAALLEHRAVSKRAILRENILLNDLFPAGSLHSFSEQEMDHYRAPFATPASRQVLWQYLQELPLGERSPGVSDLIDSYSAWLQACSIPKLLCYAVPGFVTTIDTVSWAKDNMAALDVCDLGDGLHFVQESAPQVLSDNISAWLAALPKSVQSA